MNKTNYSKIQNEIIQSLKGDSTLLMHSCCAPCSSFCLEKTSQSFAVDVFYFNPNITDETEYFKRLSEQKNFVNAVYNGKVKVVEGCYNPQTFLYAIKGLEKELEGGSRCKICYYLRMQETAKTAKELGYDYFTTTLSVSPHKNAEWINEIGVELEKKYGVKYLFADFKKEGGYLRSIELSKQYNLYRQDYCGCEFSKRK